MTPDLSDLIGTPFVNGGRDPAAGLDCWGLFCEVRRRFGLAAPDYAICCFASDLIGQAADRAFAGAWQRLDAPAPGCGVAMAIDPDLPGVVQHFGVWIGRGCIIHTLEKTGVLVSKTADPFWGRKITGYYELRHGHPGH